MKHYVYKHSTHSGIVFYVGKGINNRAYNLTARSDYHRRISAKHGCIVSFVAEGLTDQQATILEIETIALYKAEGLCVANFTLGGEGRSGLKHSDETKKKMSKSHLGKTGWFAGKTMSVESSRKKSETMKSDAINCKPIRCINSGEIYTSLTNACRALGLSGTSNLSRVLKGTRSHVNGYKFEYV